MKQSDIYKYYNSDKNLHIIIIIIIITVLIVIWHPSWWSDHSRRTLTHVNFFTLTVTFEHRTNIVAD